MKGYGTKFYRSTDDITYTQVANLLNVALSEYSRGSIENTTIDGTTGFKTFEPGLIDAGEVSLTLVWDVANTEQIALAADLESDTLRYYRVEYPDGTEVDMYGFITGWGDSIEIEEKVMRNVKFKISGKPVVTAPI